ncbi:hypothetical protein [Rhodococcus sp. BH5]|uniref:hypothetical protein n=1 Tax=Rhodococcus sp. BH5 TaxID=2871702 RepID=UPI0022CDB755|nr:hypothetical protein [Rhodococcus sp. BH5]MCZ9634709.1 hypothetical protein [Rhodococcus sp. BH5]
MRPQIPYDEMRRLCGLPDMQTLDMLAGIRKYGLNHFLNIGIQMGGSMTCWSRPKLLK